MESRGQFTRQVDIGLISFGELEAQVARRLLKDFKINMAFISLHKRAIQTLKIILIKIDDVIPIVKVSTLNERSYGYFEGLDKRKLQKSMVVKRYCYGEEVLEPGSQCDILYLRLHFT